jgi:hypothetical protein
MGAPSKNLEISKSLVALQGTELQGIGDRIFEREMRRRSPPKKVLQGVPAAKPRTQASAVTPMKSK